MSASKTVFLLLLLLLSFKNSFMAYFFFCFVLIFVCAFSCVSIGIWDLYSKCLFLADVGAKIPQGKNSFLHI